MKVTCTNVEGEWHSQFHIKFYLQMFRSFQHYDVYNNVFYFLYFCSPQVNGIDLSKATHEEAVEAFKNAAEPIAVEVLRRAPRTTTKVNAGDKDRTICTCNVGTQTDLQSEDFLWKMLQNCPSPLSPMSPMTPTGKSDVEFDGYVSSYSQVSSFLTNVFYCLQYSLGSRIDVKRYYEKIFHLPAVACGTHLSDQ